ncbi:RSP_7527 family protein [Candidatus Halocynthiibacter alkanivorans]|uniref:RSP_7527 family protein n=1 Tax=Candidatus Halocynthiibacter alkanivorans TaxID=2267619 RepID=UPI00135AB5E0|nr:hypothetical protein [Candidatus Halocynthiibacter alkanivorans]
MNSFKPEDNLDYYEIRLEAGKLRAEFLRDSAVAVTKWVKARLHIGAAAQTQTS